MSREAAERIERDGGHANSSAPPRWRTLPDGIVEAQPRDGVNAEALTTPGRFAESRHGAVPI
jgi:hypothetical protein